ncbi:hypothetical protein MP631_14270 [Xanthomonas phaseoli pv. phaseoli]|nr:hypothetical protein MP631_14270 [Xanthomonas phaseoli pv. phaseoli]
MQAGNNLSLTPTTGLDGKVATRTSISTGDSLQLTAGNDRACPRFCVTGPQAGDCHLTRRHHEPTHT